MGAQFNPGNMAHQSSRYELKFIIDERCACGVRDFLRGYLRRDAHAQPALRYSYPIYSVYFDCPGESLYRATLEASSSCRCSQLLGRPPPPATSLPTTRRRPRPAAPRRSAPVARPVGVVKTRWLTRSRIC